MAKQIKIRSGSIVVDCDLNDTLTAEKIYAVLPIKAAANRWGGEIYFSIPLEMQLEQGCTDVLKAGQLGYWPSGNAFCIFFGPTPASKADEIRAASPVNIIGSIRGDFSSLWDIKDGREVVIDAS